MGETKQIIRATVLLISMVVLIGSVFHLTMIQDDTKMSSENYNSEYISSVNYEHAHNLGDSKAMIHFVDNYKYDTFSVRWILNGSFHSDVEKVNGAEKASVNVDETGEWEFIIYSNESVVTTGNFTIEPDREAWSYN